MLAKGMTNKELARAYFAKRDTSSGGRQMPGHPSSRAKNIWSVPTPTASNLLPACGVAWGNANAWQEECRGRNHR